MIPVKVVKRPIPGDSARGALSPSREVEPWVEQACQPSPELPC